MNNPESLSRTALYPLHVEAGAKIVPFAGYEMPVQYPAGIIKEHHHTRQKAGLFDVSHMGQISVSGENAAQLLESLVPVDITNLKPGKQRYALFLNEVGGVMDDLMIARVSENMFSLVVNAACKDDDFAHLKSKLGDKLEIEMATDKSLLALQGPESANVMQRLGYDLSDMGFMDKGARKAVSDIWGRFDFSKLKDEDKPGGFQSPLARHLHDSN